MCCSCTDVGVTTLDPITLDFGLFALLFALHQDGHTNAHPRDGVGQCGVARLVGVYREEAVVRTENLLDALLHDHVLGDALELSVLEDEHVHRILLFEVVPFLLEVPVAKHVAHVVLGIREGDELVVLALAVFAGGVEGHCDESSLVFVRVPAVLEVGHQLLEFGLIGDVHVEVLHADELAYVVQVDHRVFLSAHCFVSNVCDVSQLETLLEFVLIFEVAEDADDVRTTYRFDKVEP